MWTHVFEQYLSLNWTGFNFWFIIFNNEPLESSTKKKILTPPQNLRFYVSRYVESKNRIKKNPSVRRPPYAVRRTRHFPQLPWTKINEIWYTGPVRGLVVPRSFSLPSVFSKGQKIGDEIFKTPQLENFKQEGIFFPSI